jgi:predicted nucleic acid-binding protein
VGLIERIGTGPTAVDTSIFIYWIEEHTVYLPEIEPLFEQAAAGRRELVTSSLTLHELLVVPYRNGNRRLAAQYEAVLTQARGIRMVDISLEHLRIAAQLRAAAQIKTPDALQLATAIDQRCPVFLTNDRRVPDVAGVRVVTLTAA